MNTPPAVREDLLDHGTILKVAPATWLLGSQALVDSARNERTAIHDWAEREDIADAGVCVSVVSFTHFRSTFEQSDADEWAARACAFDITLARVRGYGGLRGVTLEIVLRANDPRAMSPGRDIRAPFMPFSVRATRTARGAA